MIDGSRLQVFSVVGAVTYTLGYYFNWPLFHYLFDDGVIGWFRADPGVASISWYGWLGCAALAGGLAAALVPRRLAHRLPPDAAWLVTLVMLAATLLYEKRWFL